MGVKKRKGELFKLAGSMTYGAALCPVDKESDTKALGFVGATSAPEPPLPLVSTMAAVIHLSTLLSRQIQKSWTTRSERSSSRRSKTPLGSSGTFAASHQSQSPTP